MGNCSAHEDEASRPHAGSNASDLDPGGSDDGCRLFHLIVNDCIVGVLCGVGMVGNTISMVVLRLDRQNRIASFLLQTLACIDNLLLGFSFITLIFARTKIPDNKLTILNSFAYVVQAGSIWIIVLLGINRYYAVCKPLKVGLVTLRSAKIQVTAVFLLCVAFNVPRFFPGKSRPPQVEKFNDSSLANLSSSVRVVRREIVNSNKMAYESVYTVLVLILPLVLLICLNVKLARSLNRLRRRLMNFSKEYKGSNEANITVVMVVIVIVMVVSHTPDRVLQTLKLLQFYRDSALPMPPHGGARFPCCPNVFSTTQYLTNLFIVLSSSVNFLIYFVLRKRFRRILGYKVRRLFFKSSRRARFSLTSTVRPSTTHQRPIAL